MGDLVPRSVAEILEGDLEHTIQRSRDLVAEIAEKEDELTRKRGELSQVRRLWIELSSAIRILREHPGRLTDHSETPT